MADGHHVENRFSAIYLFITYQCR